MRRLTMIVVAGLMVGSLAAPAGATPTTYEIEGRLVDTHVFGIPADDVEVLPGDEPGFNWVSGSIWHLRGVPVTETIESLDGSTVIGFLSRTFNFNLDLATGASTAWCTFTMTFVDPDLGSFSGHCGGSLVTGLIVGNGETGHLEGTYLLEEGGVAGVGPYLIDLEIFET